MKWIFSLVLLAGLASCNSKSKTPAEETDVTSENHFEMYKMSEMAALMEKMSKEHEQVKARIEKGEAIGKMPEYYYDIQYAAFTDEHDNDDVFKNWAKLYLTAEENLYAATENKVEAYNSAVNVCIQCHSQKCGGPITRIKKLQIKQ